MISLTVCLPPTVMVPLIPIPSTLQPVAYGMCALCCDVCLCMCLCVCMFVCIYMCNVCACVRACVRVCVRVCACVRACVCAYVQGLYSIKDACTFLLPSPNQVRSPSHWHCLFSTACHIYQSVIEDVGCHGNNMAV